MKDFYAALETILPVLIEILLLFCGAFFASTETAFTSLSRITIRQMQKDKEKNANIVASLKNTLDVLISTVLIGTNFVTVLCSSLATAFSMKHFGAKYVTYTTAVVSFFIIIFMEIIPKTYAGVRTKKAAVQSALPILILQKIFFPVVWIFSWLSRFIDFIDKIFGHKKHQLITDEEFKTLLEVGETEGTLEQDERRMLDRIFEFSDVTVHSIMRHRSLVKYVNVKDSLETVIKAFSDSGYSRIPVYEDSPENIVGVLHYKAVLFADPAITQSPDFVKICMRQVMFVPETFSVLELLQHFKKEQTHFAVALNEYGSMAGIVTMDDILRGVFGRMTDESGKADLPPETRISVVASNEFIVPGDMRLDDVNEVLNLHLESDTFETLGGWLLEKLDELPPIGSVFKNENCLFIVEDQSARKIQSVRIKFLNANVN
ncbi:MAG: HlyC/CorC family transporter [Treponema sp.]|nr:HlyC/CorC family transporter [Treponema sp.]